jgi:hypothetical protein
LKQLHDRNLKATLNLHPADGVRHFEDAYKDMCKYLERDPADKQPIPFEPENRKFMDAYFDILHRRLEDDGVDFWVSLGLPASETFRWLMSFDIAVDRLATTTGSRRTVVDLEPLPLSRFVIERETADHVHEIRWPGQSEIACRVQRRYSDLLGKFGLPARIHRHSE